MHIFDTLKNLSHETLLNQFSQIVSREKEITAQVVAYLAEVRKRKLYAEEGYSSLFSFLTEKYRYSKGAAYRRIQGAKVALLFPEVLELLASGKLQLISLCLIEPHLTLSNGKELLSRVIGKSKEEIEYELGSLFPKVEKNRDKIRRLPIASLFPKEIGAQSQLTETDRSEANRFHCGTDSEKLSQKSLAEPEPKPIRRVKIEFVADEGVADLIERARALLSHKYPKGRLEDLVREAFQTLLEKRDPMRSRKPISSGNGRAACLSVKQVQEPNKSNYIPGNEESERKKEMQSAENLEDKKREKNRYIPKKIRKEIWKRDEGRCTFVNIEGRRCDERLFLELDHIRPFALNGKTETSNLRLLCAAHNRWRSEY
jgi:hypothetical protein